MKIRLLLGVVLNANFRLIKLRQRQATKPLSVRLKTTSRHKNGNLNLKKLTLRNGKLEDLAELQQLFVDTIKTICRNDYDAEQIKVWTSGIENIERWEDIFKTQYILVAEQANKIVGFATLGNGNYIDLFYVHKDFQRQGIAQKLYEKIEVEARRQRQTELTSDVSKTAKPFFKHVGFEEVKEQKIIRKGVELINFKMIKELSNEDKTNEK